MKQKCSFENGKPIIKLNFGEKDIRLDELSAESKEIHEFLFFIVAYEVAKTIIIACGSVMLYPSRTAN